MKNTLRSFSVKELNNIYSWNIGIKHSHKFSAPSFNHNLLTNYNKIITFEYNTLNIIFKDYIYNRAKDIVLILLENS